MRDGMIEQIRFMVIWAILRILPDRFAKPLLVKEMMRLHRLHISQIEASFRKTHPNGSDEMLRQLVKGYMEQTKPKQT